MSVPENERMVALSNPTQTEVKALRDAGKIWLCRSARGDIFEIEFAGFCNLRTQGGKDRHPEVRASSASLEG
jgi:hypothetical protein